MYRETMPTPKPTTCLPHSSTAEFSRYEYKAVEEDEEEDEDTDEDEDGTTKHVTKGRTNFEFRPHRRPCWRSSVKLRAGSCRIHKLKRRVCLLQVAWVIRRGTSINQVVRTLYSTCAGLGLSD